MGTSAAGPAGAAGLDEGSRTTLSRYRKGEPFGTNRDLLERVGHMLSIHKSLRVIFPKNRELAYCWMTTRDAALQNKTPVEIINEYGVAGLLMVRLLLDKDRGE